MMSACALALCTVQLSVVNSDGVPASQVRAFERSDTVQSRQLARYWGTPAVRFGARGARINILRPADRRLGGGGGFHAFRKGRPYAIVAARDYWTVIASHEMVEMLVNPHANSTLDGYLLEVADPVRLLAYRLRGVWMADFVTRQWFDPNANGPYDFLRRLSRPHSITFGHAETVNARTGQTRTLLGWWMRHGREAPFEQASAPTVASTRLTMRAPDGAAANWPVTLSTISPPE